MNRLLVVVVAWLPACHGRPTVQRAEGGERHPASAAVVAAPGIVEPWGGEVRLSAAEPGQLVEILVAEGQTVRAGDLLARLEDSRQRAALRVAEAEVRQARAQLAGTAPTPEEIQAARAELAAAAARAEQQARDSARAAALGSSGALSPAEVERTHSERRADDAMLDVARARLVVARRGARRSERELGEARAEAAEARLVEARAALARREVRATADGVVLWSRAHAGEYHAPERGPLFVLGDLRRVQVRLELDDGDAGALRPGTRCELRDDDGAGRGAGTVARVAFEYGSRSLASERPSARSDARVREVFVEVPGGALAPGQRVWGHCARAVAGG